MKKNVLRRILPLTLIFTLILCNAVFATELSADVSDIQSKIGDAMDIKLSDESNNVWNQKTTKGLKKSGTISLPVLNNSDQMNTLLNGDSAKLFALNQTGQAEEFTFKPNATGKILVAAWAHPDNTGSAKITVLKNNTPIKTVSNSLPKNSGIYDVVPVSKNITYKIRFDAINTTQQNVYAYDVGLVNGENNRTFSGSNVLLSSGTKVQWKVKATKNSAYAISAVDLISQYPTNIKVTLLDSKKKVVSAATTLGYSNGSADSVCYGLTGGKNYYVKVETKAPIYGFIGTQKAYTAKVGTKKSKATSLGLKKSKNTTLAASTSASTAQWYKIKLSKKKAISIVFEGYVAPGSTVKMQLLNKKGKALSTFNISGRKNYGKKAEIYTKKGSKLAKGTYYIKISKTSKKSSAAYNLKYAK